MIEKLKKIEFHDLEVIKLELDMINNFIKLEVFVFNEDTNNYVNTKVIFSYLSNVSFDNFFTDKEFFIEEINSFELFENRLYRAKFIFLQGFSKPSCELSFDFVSCTIE